MQNESMAAARFQRSGGARVALSCGINNKECFFLWCHAVVLLLLALCGTHGMQSYGLVTRKRAEAGCFFFANLARQQEQSDSKS